MNILEKVPHKRLHFRFGERILAKVLHPSTTKMFVGKPPAPSGNSLTPSKAYEDHHGYRGMQQPGGPKSAFPNLGAPPPPPSSRGMRVPGDEFLASPHFSYLASLQMAEHQRSKEARVPPPFRSPPDMYHPRDLSPPMSPPYYNDHRHNLSRNPRVPPPPHSTPSLHPPPPSHGSLPPLDMLPYKNDQLDLYVGGNPREPLRGKPPTPVGAVGSTTASMAGTPPVHNPSVSPYSGHETPDSFSPDSMTEDVDVDSSDELIVDTDTE